MKSGIRFTESTSLAMLSNIFRIGTAKGKGGGNGIICFTSMLHEREGHIHRAVHCKVTRQLKSERAKKYG